jgi:hypothetical protein
MIRFIERFQEVIFMNINKYEMCWMILYEQEMSNSVYKVDQVMVAIMTFDEVNRKMVRVYTS